LIPRSLGTCAPPIDRRSFLFGMTAGTLIAAAAERRGGGERSGGGGGSLREICSDLRGFPTRKAGSRLVGQGVSGLGLYALDLPVAHRLYGSVRSLEALRTVTTAHFWTGTAERRTRPPGKLAWIDRFKLHFYVDHTAGKGYLHLWDGEKPEAAPDGAPRQRRPHCAAQ